MEITSGVQSAVIGVTKNKQTITQKKREKHDDMNLMRDTMYCILSPAL